jgi:hypothetical protein
MKEQIQPVNKEITAVKHTAARHWVGDGFPVRSLFSYQDLGRDLNPFILLDYAGPAEFPPTEDRLGVGEHPHRGFETVTIVYSGQVEHRDSSGGGGSIGPGDVQWMTAASGVVHEEFHGRGFAARGGRRRVPWQSSEIPKKSCAKSSARPAASSRQKRRYVSFWKGCAAKKPSPNCAAATWGSGRRCSTYDVDLTIEIVAAEVGLDLTCLMR